MSDADTAKALLESNIYCTIATVCDDGFPWSTPVFFGYDDQLNLYWRSSTESVHSRNIAARPRVCITVFNSQAAWGTGRGVYLKGTAKVVEDRANIERALAIMDRRSSQQFSPEEFMAPNPRRVYSFTPKQMWRNVDGEVNGKFVDQREELEILQ